MDTRREATLERQIDKVKRDLVVLGDLRPGSLSTQYNVCGTPGCRCKATPPEKHGPYYQVSYTRKGKSSTKFVKQKDLPAVRKQLKKQIPKSSPKEAEQLAVLDEYASGIVTALNTEGLQPFKYATVEAAQALDEVEASLQQLEKRGPQ